MSYRWHGAWALWLCLLSTALFCSHSHAFPPAPQHTLFGLVRDEWGTMLALTNASVILENPQGKKLAEAKIYAALDRTVMPPVNYRMAVAMDSGVTPDTYRSNSMVRAAPFKLRVRIGSVNYVPIEMVGTVHPLGHPGKNRRMDLTLGVDADGDGLPDSWEQALLAAVGKSGNNVDPNGDENLDGRRNQVEFMANISPYDPAGHRLVDMRLVDGKPTFSFFALSGRNYSIEASTDLSAANWTPVSFRVPTEDPDIHTEYAPWDFKILDVQVETSVPANSFFRLKVQ